jgi:uncharacterized protein YndB with AHSA1/START domain
MNDYGVLTAPDTLRIERLLPGPIERVWQYLTDSDKRATWLAARLAHAIGVAKRATSPARSAGALGTFAVLLVAAGWLLVANL